jgi:hypothetical protein
VITTPPETDTSGTETALETTTTLLAPGGSGSATSLRAKTGCRTQQPWKPFARLRWSVAAERGNEQRIAVTIFPEEFVGHEFKNVQSVSPSRASFVWTNLSGQGLHYWVVLTRHGDAWTPSATARFTGPLCIADVASP